MKVSASYEYLRSKVSSVD